MKKLDFKKLKIEFKAFTKEQKKRLAVETAVVVFLIALDLATKFAAFALLGEGKPPVILIDGFLLFETARNDGVAFSFFSGMSRYFGVFSILLSIGIAWYLLKYPYESKRKFLRFGLILLLAGGVGNGIERVIYGYVRDFILVPFYSTFNIADMLIVVGAAFIIISILLMKDDKNNKAENTPKPSDGGGTAEAPKDSDKQDKA